VRDLERETRVLLDQQDRHAALLVQPRQQGKQVLRDGRREAERGLVAHQDARLGHQGARDRQHLLLAAGETAGKLLAPRREQGKTPYQ